MSVKADRERDERWKRAGHGRLTMRITANSEAVLNQLARQHRCSRRDVVEGLLLGTITAKVNPEVVFAVRERLSACEALELARGLPR